MLSYVAYREVSSMDGDGGGGQEDGGGGVAGGVAVHQLPHRLLELRVRLAVHVDAVGVVRAEHGGQQQLQLAGVRVGRDEVGEGEGELGRADHVPLRPVK